MNKIEIQKILVPVDFTETSRLALAEAMTLAKRVKAEVFILHVIETDGYYTSIFPESNLTLPSFAMLKKEVKKKMNSLQEKTAKKYGISPHVYVIDGHIDTEIISLSKKKKIDFIVMGAHGASGYKEMFIGSNAQRVITLSAVPVLTVHDTKRKVGFKNILIPIDNSFHSREKVNMGMLFAEAFKSRIHLIGLPVSNDAEEVNEIKIKLASIEKIISAMNLSYKTSIIHGKNIAKTAVKYAEENANDLIVINTGHESKLTGIFLGAFAQQIVNHSTVPVLSFKHSPDHYSIDVPGFGID